MFSLISNVVLKTLYKNPVSVLFLSRILFLDKVKKAVVQYLTNCWGIEEQIFTNVFRDGWVLFANLIMECLEIVWWNFCSFASSFLCWILNFIAWLRFSPESTVKKSVTSENVGQKSVQKYLNESSLKLKI